MERRRRSIGLAEVFLILGLLATVPCRLSALSVTVNEVECVYEFVLYEGDTVSGNFVVVDHDIFWNSDHPGIDLVVSLSYLSIPRPRAVLARARGRFFSRPRRRSVSPRREKDRGDV
ncbi:hypothetical protein BHM03_00052264, partial [Ensete ventricosum]